ncbi:hypothetical protein QFC20_006429 [Naganishia adeliensis]|uniref:Uncharacterized protein n=1 Tax=Naganishia adeliensis TaxID=92952 RepID=A0ACC2VBN2_9TREE|nr:hypothetical protein QFC20_006429 [Naganishia adeliensis]
MSQPSITKRSQAAYAKRTKPVEASSQPAPSKRPPLPLPPAEKTSNDRVLRESNIQLRVDHESHSNSNAVQNLRPRAVVEKTYSDKQKAQLFSVVCDEMKQLKQKSSRLTEERRKVDEDRVKLAEDLREAKYHILQMEIEAQRRRDAQIYRPIERPCITKEETVNIRLTGTRELLGLQFDKSDKVGKKWTYKGMMKDRSWKLLLAMSREVVTWGIQLLELTAAPEWKKLHKTRKRQLVEEAKNKKWCIDAMKPDPRPHDIQIEDWPPPRADELVTPVDHEKFKQKSRDDKEVSDAEASADSSNSDDVPLSRKHQKTAHHHDDQDEEAEGDAIDLEEQDQGEQDVDLEHDDDDYEREKDERSMDPDTVEKDSDTDDEQHGGDDSEEHEYSDATGGEENFESEDEQPVRSKRRLTKNTASAADELNI